MKARLNMTTTNLAWPLATTVRRIGQLVLFLGIAAVAPSTALAWKFENMYASGGRSGLHYANGQYRTSDGRTPAISRSDNTPLNMFYSFGVHNAYEHMETSVYAILKDVSPQIEFDIRDADVLGDVKGDWRVAHDTSTSGRRANCSRDLDPSAPAANLSHCLQAVQRFHDDFPDHDLISIWIELKSPVESWSTKADKTADDLDILIGKTFSNSDLYRPADLKGTYSTARHAAQAGRWATLGSLKGKIMITLFSPFDNDNSQLDDYATARGASAKAFVAPHVYKNGTTTGSVEQPGGMSAEGTKWSVMFDLVGDSYSNHSHGLRIAKYNYIASTYKVNNQDTPAISEYRDFFIQQGRIDEISNSATVYAYAGRLNIEEKFQSSSCFGCGDHLPLVAQIHLPRLAGTKCVAIKDGGTSDKTTWLSRTADQATRASGSRLSMLPSTTTARPGPRPTAAISSSQ
jgi:hypothetical protein